MPFFLLLCILSCNEHKLKSNIWKIDNLKQYQIFEDSYKQNSLWQNYKNEIVELLDTTEIKQFKIKNNEWMYVIFKPNSITSEDSRSLLLIISL